LPPTAKSLWFIAFVVATSRFPSAMVGMIYLQLPATTPWSCHSQIPIPRHGGTAEPSRGYTDHTKLCCGSASSLLLRRRLLGGVEPVTGTVIKIAALLLLSIALMFI